MIFTIISPVVKSFKNWNFWGKLGAMVKEGVVSGLQGNLGLHRWCWPKSKPGFIPQEGKKKLLMEIN